MENASRAASDAATRSDGGAGGDWEGWTGEVGICWPLPLAHRHTTRNVRRLPISDYTSPHVHR